jgi:hypothetical protein
MYFVFTTFKNFSFLSMTSLSCGEERLKVSFSPLSTTPKKQQKKEKKICKKKIFLHD